MKEKGKELRKKLEDFLYNVLYPLEDDKESIELIHEDNELHQLLFNSIDSHIWLIEDKVLKLKGLRMIRSLKKVPLQS